MAYNKASEERKWRYWKEQEEKKLRELGMDEEKIQKLRQMDWEDFLEERRYRERLEETMQEIDTGKPEDGEPFAMDVRELLDHVGNRGVYELLKDTGYSCAMKSHFRKFGNQMFGSGNHLCKYASLLA